MKLFSKKQFVILGLTWLFLFILISIIPKLKTPSKPTSVLIRYYQGEGNVFYTKNNLDSLFIHFQPDLVLGDWENENFDSENEIWKQYLNQIFVKYKVPFQNIEPKHPARTSFLKLREKALNNLKLEDFEAVEKNIQAEIFKSFQNKNQKPIEYLDEKIQTSINQKLKLAGIKGYNFHNYLIRWVGFMGRNARKEIENHQAKKVLILSKATFGYLMKKQISVYPNIELIDFRLD